MAFYWFSFHRVYVSSFNQDISHTGQLVEQNLPYYYNSTDGNEAFPSKKPRFGKHFENSQIST